MKRIFAATALAGLLGLGAWQAAEALQSEPGERAALAQPAPAPAADEEAPANASAASPSRSDTSRPDTSRGAPSLRAATPMAERVAVIGVLNKRNGIERDLTMKPGQAMRLGDIIVRLRACEATAPWEPEKLTGAFIQADVHGRDNKWRRIFSGWVFKESPSLNMVENQIYDVWPKSCAMRHPDIGPDTVAAGSAGGGSRSSAKKSGDDVPASNAPSVVPPPVVAPSAPSNNAT